MSILSTHKPYQGYNADMQSYDTTIFDIFTPPSSSSSVLRTEGKSAGLSAGKEAPLKAQGPISLVQMQSLMKISRKSPSFI